jgi:hypothetical protein
MILCGLDFETTGLQIGKVGITEVGLVRWDTELGAPIQMTGFLVDPPKDAIWEPGVEKLTTSPPPSATNMALKIKPPSANSSSGIKTLMLPWRTTDWRLIVRC